MPLQSLITHVQPMTGIVFWSTSEHNRTDAIQLEYSYMKYGDVVSDRGQYDWSAMDRLLEQVAAPGTRRSCVITSSIRGARPLFLATSRDSRITTKCKPRARGSPRDSPTGRTTSSSGSRLSFAENLAQRYDADPRLAFLETGFGLWAEYHIYDGPMRLGKTFPDKAFQADFARHLSRVFHKTPGSSRSTRPTTLEPLFISDRDLLKLPFGVFDDSFLCQQHARENEPNWNAMGRERWKRTPAGGELSYYTERDQKLALAPTGPHGIPFEQAAAAFRITFMIGDGQPRYQPMARISAAGMACGYRFRIRAFEASPSRSRVRGRQHGRGADLSQRIPCRQRRPRRHVAQGSAPRPIAD